MENEYIYAVTRIHTQERYLLSEQDVQRLVSAEDAEECFRLLGEKGWGTDLPANDADALLSREQEKTWAFLKELIGDLSPFDIFLIENDYHNLKAAIKLVYSAMDGQNAPAYFRGPSSLPPESILRAARQHNFSELPPALAEAGQAADSILTRTGSGQACDMQIDVAALMAIDAAGKASSSQLLREYATLKIDTANIKAAVRSALMGKPREFLERAIAPAGSLHAGELALAAATSFDAVIAYLGRTRYADAAGALRSSLPAFERWCDDALIESIRPQKAHYFSIEPLAAYLIARENEIAMVRLILAAKANRLDAAILRERIRKMYV